MSKETGDFILGVQRAGADKVEPIARFAAGVHVAMWGDDKMVVVHPDHPPILMTIAIMNDPVLDEQLLVDPRHPAIIVNRALKRLGGEEP